MGRPVPEEPDRIRKLPLDEKGRYVPWFVWWDDKGVPDFRVIGAGKIVEAINEKRCWVCGEKLGKYKAFVIGPMCAVNRISSEPPSHLECAVYSAKACPFLTTPKMHRREKGLPLDYSQAAGIAITRNPGVTLVWTTLSFGILKVDRGVLFQVGDPVQVEWYAEGRIARRAEILDSIESGLPILQKEASEDPVDPGGAMKQLDRMLVDALKLVPKEAV